MLVYSFTTRRYLYNTRRTSPKNIHACSLLLPYLNCSLFYAFFNVWRTFSFIFQLNSFNTSTYNCIGNSTMIQIRMRIIIVSYIKSFYWLCGIVARLCMGKHRLFSKIRGHFDTEWPLKIMYMYFEIYFIY